ncbi:MAG TPA: LysE family translocator [Gammaproteobacteria bacterium]
MESLLPLVSFAFASSITPGPNNLMLSASGIAFGLKRTLPHLLGVFVGFLMLLVVCAGGVGAAVAVFPVVGLVLKIGGSLYLLYLAWSMRRVFVPGAEGKPARPLKVVEAALFQFANPKAWLMAVTAASVFVPQVAPRELAVLVVCGVFAAVNLPCIGIWALLGASLRRGLALERWGDYLGLVVGVLMLYAVASLWVGGDSPIAPMPVP